MASIYQPQGPSVPLRGPSVAPGFNPVQAPDFSRQILAKAESNFLRSQRDISALAGFSDSLNKFLIERSAERNKEIFDQELARVLSGEIEPDPQAFQNFKQKESILQTAASAEAQVVNETAQESAILANTLENKSVALTGWKGYARAVGMVKRAAMMSQVMLQEFMMSDEKIIPITRPDGTSIMISPKEAGYSGDMAEIAAAQRVGIQQLIDRAGISGINPVILAEHLTPTVMNIQSAIASNRAAEVRKFKQEEAKERVQENIAFDFMLPEKWETPESRFEWIQGLTRDLMSAAGLTRRAAKDQIVRDLINRAIVTRDGTKLRQLADTQYRDGDPGLIGEVFMVEIAEAEEKIIDAERKEIERNRLDLDNSATSMYQEYEARLMAGEDAAALRQEYLPAFQELYKGGSPKALDFAKELALGGNYNPYVAQAYRDRYAAGDFPTLEERQQDLRLGRINASEFREFQSLDLPDAAKPLFEAIQKDLQNEASQAIIQRNKLGGALDVNKAIVQTRANQLADDVGRFIYRYIQQNPNATPEDLRNLVETRVQAAVQQPQYEYDRKEQRFKNPVGTRGNAPDVADFPSRPAASPAAPQRPRAFLSPSQLSQIRSANSRSAAILEDARSSPLQRARALVDANQSIQRAIQRRQMQQDQAALPPMGGIGPAAQALMDFIGNAEGGRMQWDAVNRGTAGDTPDGMPGLSNMTVGQVMALQQSGRINAAGRYQFTPAPLRETVAQLGLDPNTKFDRNTQNQLFMARIQSGVRPALRDYVQGRGNNIDAALRDLANEFAVVRRPGGGGRYDGIAGNRASLLDSDAARLLNSLRAENMRLGFSGARGPVYKVDSLGYGSTGPHIDVKPVRRGTNQTDRSISYQKGTLDRFVEIVLPNGRRGSLSSLATTTDDDRAHRARGSFGHDYAAERGSQVFLKNGARVVDSFKGEQNTDHLIIELPDGRRFQFLHGTRL
jgi:hypothetical protein